MQEKNFYQVAPITVEEAERQLKEFVKTDSGSRIEKCVKQSAVFTQKHDKKPIMVSTMKYFGLIAYHLGIYDSLIMMYFYAYRKGYERAKREKCNKHNK